MSVNVNLIEQNVIQVNSEITDVNVKNIIYVKKIKFRTLVHAVVKTRNI